jgi:hypothetical protein
VLAREVRRRYDQIADAARIPPRIGVNAFSGIFGTSTAAADQLRGHSISLRSPSGVDPQKYAQDLYECTEAKKNAGFITFGAPISNCLESKGYRVEIRKS